jgi:YHS domain-containing protein
METLLYFLVFGALFLLMMRFGCGAHTMGHGHGGARRAPPGAEGNPRWVPPAKDTDPVCGMTVATAGAKSAVHDGSVYYFCSADCRDKFEAAPASFVKAPAAAPEKEHHHEHRH